MKSHAKDEFSSLTPNSALRFIFDVGGNMNHAMHGTQGPNASVSSSSTWSSINNANSTSTTASTTTTAQEKATIDEKRKHLPPQSPQSHKQHRQQPHQPPPFSSGASLPALSKLLNVSLQEEEEDKAMLQLSGNAFQLKTLSYEEHASAAQVASVLARAVLAKTVQNVPATKRYEDALLKLARSSSYTMTVEAAVDCLSSGESSVRVAPDDGRPSSTPASSTAGTSGGFWNTAGVVMSEEEQRLKMIDKYISCCSVLKGSPLVCVLNHMRVAPVAAPPMTNHTVIWAATATDAEAATLTPSAEQHHAVQPRERAVTAVTSTDSLPSHNVGGRCCDDVDTCGLRTPVVTLPGQALCFLSPVAPIPTEAAAADDVDTSGGVDVRSPTFKKSMTLAFTAESPAPASGASPDTSLSGSKGNDIQPKASQPQSSSSCLSALAYPSPFPAASLQSHEKNEDPLTDTYRQPQPHHMSPFTRSETRDQRHHVTASSGDLPSPEFCVNVGSAADFSAVPSECSAISGFAVASTWNFSGCRGLGTVDGFIPFLGLLQSFPSLTALYLRGIDLEERCCSVLVLLCEAHLRSLGLLDLCGNSGVKERNGRELKKLMNSNRRMCRVEVEGTAISRKLAHALTLLGRRNVADIEKQSYRKSSTCCSTSSLNSVKIEN